jgi:hypothetical protein
MQTEEDASQGVFFKVTVSPRNHKQIVIPLIMALGNHVIKEIGLVEKINEETVRWILASGKSAPDNWPRPWFWPA